MLESVCQPELYEDHPKKKDRTDTYLVGIVVVPVRFVSEQSDHFQSRRGTHLTAMVADESVCASKDVRFQNIETPILQLPGHYVERSDDVSDYAAQNDTVFAVDARETVSGSTLCGMCVAGCGMLRMNQTESHLNMATTITRWTAPERNRNCTVGHK